MSVERNSWRVGLSINRRDHKERKETSRVTAIPCAPCGRDIQPQKGKRILTTDCSDFTKQIHVCQNNALDAEWLETPDSPR
jgi:deoxycytidylate deaminase